MAQDCTNIFRLTYDGFIAAGRTVTEANYAAQAAMSACLQQTAAPVAAPQVSIPGGRLSDDGPRSPRRT